MTGQPDISVVVPFYNEEGNIRNVHEAIVTAVEQLRMPFEIVLVNDGSFDRTLEIAIEIARSDERVRIVNFRRNYGQTPAMAAGIEYAQGKVLVTMDGDLQNDPRDIEHLLAKIDEGYDIVVGWRVNRKDKLISRRIPSTIANWIIGKVTGVPIKDNGCSLKAYRASLIKKIPLYSEMHRFIPAMAWIAGARIAEIPVRHNARLSGQSKYGLSRIYKVMLDLMVVKALTSFTARPMSWFALLASPLALLSVVALAAATWEFNGGTDGLSLPKAGAGIVLLTGSIILLGGGMLSEVIYRLGDVRERDFSRLTDTVWKRGSTGSCAKRQVND